MAEHEDMHVRVEVYAGVAGMLMGEWNQLAEKI
jgi:hypothetical protein